MENITLKEQIREKYNLSKGKDLNHIGSIMGYINADIRIDCGKSQGDVDEFISLFNEVDAEEKAKFEA
jgi:hypothetical protein